MAIEDLIYVNNFGVSKVVDIKGDTAYVSPLKGTNGVILIKENSSSIRKLLNKEEIDNVLRLVSTYKTNWTTKFIERTNIYSAIKNNPSPEKRLIMLKTIYNHYKYKKENKIKGGLANRDIDFFRKSLSLITTEFCTVLHISQEELKNYISLIWQNNSFFEYYLI